MPSRSPRSLTRGALPALAIVVALAGLTACTSKAPAPALQTPSAAPTSSAAPTPNVPFSATAPESVALGHFDQTIETLAKKNGAPSTADVVNALVAAGFDKKAMQVTSGSTTIGRAVDSIEFSVLWQGKTCLIGQAGSSGISSTTAPPLSTGKCLVGTTATLP